MEEKENSSSGGGITVTVSGEDAPESYRIAPRTENPPQFASPATISAPPANPTVSPAPASSDAVTTKKKRGRPRKYGPDGSVSLALSPMPISASIPLTGEFSAWKRGRGRPSSGEDSSPAAAAAPPKKSHHKYEVYETPPPPGQGIAYSVGANFTPHVLNVNAGEDVTMKVMTFSQQGARAICILSANGTISNVTLRQPTSSGGTLTYEGRFEILSLSGSYMPMENGGTKSRSGGMSVSLAGPDGRVVGGGLAGLLVAAGPVQVVVGSFLPGHQQEQKAKKQRIEPITTISSPPIINSVSGDDTRALYGGIKPMVTPAAFSVGNNSSPINPIQGFRNSVPENINNKPASMPEEEAKGLSHSNCEVSC